MTLACSDRLEELGDLLLNLVPPSSAFAAHLDACAGCRALAARAKEAMQTPTATALPTAEVWDGIVARLRPWTLEVPMPTVVRPRSRTVAVLDKARAAVKRKNYEYAVELYVLHLRKHPADLDARKACRTAARLRKKLSGRGGFLAKARAKKLEIQASSIRINKTDPAKTLNACEELLKQDPDVVPALLRLGEAATCAGLEDVAIYAFEDALSLDTENREALRLLGRVQRSAGHLDKALRCYQRLHRLDPGDREAADEVRRIPASIVSIGYERGAAKGGFQGLIDADEAEQLEAQTQRVRTAKQALERIQSDLQGKHEANPEDVDVIRRIAELYVKAELPETAIEWCDKALLVEPDHARLSELRGELVLERFRVSLRKLKLAYSKRKDPAIKAKHAKVSEQLRAYEIEELSRRVDAHPTEPGRSLPLGKALFDAGRIDEAISALQTAKRDPRKKSEACYYLGQCFIKKKILNLALKELKSAREELFEMDALNKDITYLIARIYEGAKKRAEARAEYERIAEVDFDYKDVVDRLEWLT